MFNTVKKKTGFTLIEVIVSVSIFVIGVVLLFPIFSNGTLILGESKKKSIVADLARQKMSEIEARGFIVNPVNEARTSFGGGYADYEYEVQWTSVLQDVADPTQDVSYEAKVIVYAPGKSGEQVTQFITYVTRMSPY